MLSKTLAATTLLVLTISAACGQSTTVSFSAGPGEKDIFFNGLALPNGNQVEVGYFSPGFDVVGNTFNLPSLAAAWHSLGLDNITTIFGQSGRFAGTASTADPNFAGNKICLWIFKTSNNGAPTPSSYANVQAYGLFSGSSANWLFPAAGIPPGNMTSVTSSQADQAYFGLNNDPLHLVLNPVPEPSTLALLAASAGSMVWFFRYRSRR